ncbi:hypothetical protein J7384_07185 [Endozoicomonas sp. G2_1]|uniref:tetratricopeptide repeat protein n=1 Tax=Endozoicomonas sp. G2_1 TaxID=2821091 RepID=UPI001ADAA2CE|nr:tetratricopeptide repeat protein [Endozoicomonas sp. G2_1]MBO9490139.1 hypothetical protein [Endozoicomonas sp. G2_1]
MVFKRFCVGIIGLWLTGCSVLPIDQVKVIKPFSLPINYELIDHQTVDVIDEEELFALSDGQQQAFLNQYQHYVSHGYAPHKAIFQILKSDLTDFTYYGETNTAQQTASLARGNCMSLAVLTTAYAKLANVDFDYRKVNTLPIFEKQGNVILSSSHVQTYLYKPNFKPEIDTYYLRPPGIVVDYFPSTTNMPGRLFSKHQFIAMYYRNIAADYLIDNELEAAFAYALASHQYDQHSPENINLLAVLHRRLGDVEGAEAIYQAALAHDLNNVAMLSNYATLLKSQQRYQEAEILDNKIAGLEDLNPYQWLEQAYVEHRQGRVAAAKRYYYKVIEQAPYVHQAYLGLYQIYAKQHQLNKAREMLKKALTWSYELDDRKLYKAKLYSLW